jgi:hypothetical protein
MTVVDLFIPWTESLEGFVFGSFLFSIFKDSKGHIELELDKLKNTIFYFLILSIPISRVLKIVDM